MVRIARAAAVAAVAGGALLGLAGTASAAAPAHEGGPVGFYHHHCRHHEGFRDHRWYQGRRDDDDRWRPAFSEHSEHSDHSEHGYGEHFGYGEHEGYRR
jgi:hypothetical protein